MYECRPRRRYDNKWDCYPPAPPLPKSCVDSQHAFQSIGIDYAGPLFVKNIYSQSEDDPIFKSLLLPVRAIYLDLATDCSALACINVLKRFISRRGTP